MFTRLIRRIRRVQPCPCGCNFIETRRGNMDWSKLNRLDRWATKARL